MIVHEETNACNIKTDVPTFCTVFMHSYRLCAIVGGVFATSIIVNGFLSTFLAIFTSERKKDSMDPAPLLINKSNISTSTDYTPSPPVTPGATFVT